MRAFRVGVSTIICGIFIYGSCFVVTVFKTMAAETHFQTLHEKLPMARHNELYDEDNPDGTKKVAETFYNIAKVAYAEDNRLKFFWDQYYYELAPLHPGSMKTMKKRHDARIEPMPPGPPYDAQHYLIYVEVPMRVSFGIVRRVVLIKHLTWI